VTPAIRLRGISRLYGAGAVALKGVDADVMQGEFVSMVGKSGSGKSTLLNVIGLLDQPTTGVYELHGKSTAVASERDRCAMRACEFGFVFQAFHLLDHRSLAQNVELGSLYLGLPSALRRQRAVDVLDRLGLGDKKDRTPNTLSGGERQRVAIARALMGNPSILLCDEPTGNLDTENSASVVELIRDLNTEGTTVVIVTHDLEVAAAADRTIELRDGLVVSGGLPS